MDGRHHNGAFGKDGALQEWTRNANDTLTRLDPSNPSRPRPTIRTVTPELTDEGDDLHTDLTDFGAQFDGSSSSVQTTPRTTPVGERARDKRQGFVLFNDPFHPDDMPTDSSVKPSRPRTRTLDELGRPRAPSGVSKSRHRIGSVHSASVTHYRDMDLPPTREELPVRAQSDTFDGNGMSSGTTGRKTLQKSNSIKERKVARRLIKRSSRPSSPSTNQTPPPSVDSLPTPVATSDAKKILQLIKMRCGYMRGLVDYQIGSRGPWKSGVAYIDVSKGSLMFEDDDRGPFHVALLPDLRGCRVKPSFSTEKQAKSLEIFHACLGSELRLLSDPPEEYDDWLAALLGWQQIRPHGEPSSQPRVGYEGERKAAEYSRRGSVANNGEDGSIIIKAGKLLLWDKGAPSSPHVSLNRPSTRSPRPSSRMWRRVSCTLKDNGEFRLMTEDDVKLLSVIQLSQLSRCAVQQLDRSVLEEPYCIGIFPQYTSTSTALSIIRPVYIALESRVLFEVWFVLLRAFAIPEIYGPPTTIQDGDHSDVSSIPDVYTTPTSDMFRIEKSLVLRVVEAKIRMSKSRNASITQRNAQDPSIGDYVAEVTLDGEVRARTMTKTATCAPFWREDYEFMDMPATLPELQVSLKRVEQPSTVSNSGLKSTTSVQNPSEAVTETVVGNVEIRLDRLEKAVDVEKWWPILDEHEERIGEMFLKVRHDEIAILMAKDYQPISELLHKFSTGLTDRIAHVIPAKLRRLSEILMNIFQVSGKATEWINAMVEDEIDGLTKDRPTGRIRFARRLGSNDSFETAGDREQSVRDMGRSLTGQANLLFRGNSLLTQALDCHMKRLGREYMEEVLLEKINEINNLNPDCEVDPSRLRPDEDLTKNWSQLTVFATEVWENIQRSAHKCPAEIRHILKYIRACADDRYGDFLRTVSYTSVSGFLFLRFFCPAILNPKLFGLLRDHPQPKAQRTLTLIAKTLQVLANLSTFGQKEEWMVPMNRFLGTHRQGLRDFIDEVTSIPAERNNIAVPASYMTPIKILARLPPTSREGFPSLPYLIDHARNFAALVKLWLESTTQYLASEAFDGDLLEFHNECVNLQARTDECFDRAEEGFRSTAEPYGVTLDYVVDRFDKTLIHDPGSAGLESIGSSYNPFEGSLASHNGSRTGPGSAAGSEVDPLERKERPGIWEARFGSSKELMSPGGSLVNMGLSQSPPSAPPSAGGGRNGKQHKSFLAGLRRKGGKEGMEWQGGMI